MNAIIDAAQNYSRTVLAFLGLILGVGFYSYLAIPKESSPDVSIPILYVSLGLNGISPQDSERLLIKPMEQELAEVDGLKTMNGTAYQGGGFILLEYNSGFDADEAIADVREKIDRAKPSLPAAADDPTVSEVNLSEAPVLVITIAGDVPERTLLRITKDLQGRLEQIPAVLEATLGGDREQQVEIIIDPLILESYGLDINSVAQTVAQSNTLVAAGNLESSSGSYSVKVPGLLETVEDVLNMPIKSGGDSVVRFADVATATRSFKDPSGFARVNGQPALTLELKKKAGENIIETIEIAREIVSRSQENWPAGVKASFSQDQSTDIKGMLKELTNNVIASILLVMIVIIGALGLRSGTLVGMAIPGSFLLGFLVLFTSGLTVNMVVLFALILASGMLVDGAIVVTEFADRKVTEGVPRKEAFAMAAKRMAWPIIASTATTLAAFAPLAFWPGIMGQFMKYLPITLLVTLSASLLMALIFIPVLGAYLEIVLAILFVVGAIAVAFGAFSNADAIAANFPIIPAAAAKILLPILALIAMYVLYKVVMYFMDDSGKKMKPEPKSAADITGGIRLYTGFLKGVLYVPWLVIILALCTLVGSWMFYFSAGKGVEFFPDVEPEFATIQVHARGNTSIYEKDRLLKEIEDEILRLHAEKGEFHNIYARSQASVRGGTDQAEDVIGTVTLEFTDWFSRRPANEILNEVRERSEKFAGVTIEVQKAEAGPPTGKAIQLQLASDYPEILDQEASRVSAYFRTVEGLRDLEDGLPIPGVEWQLDVDRAQAAKFGIGIGTIGTYVRLLTNGVTLTSYRPDDSEDELDINVRFPKEFRSITNLDRVRIQTQQGPLPISNFVTRSAQPKVSQITRVDQKRVRTLKADLLDTKKDDGQPLYLPNDKVTEIEAWLKDNPLDRRVAYSFKGEDEEQAAAMAFLSQAFMIALFIMAVILVTQFNSFYSAFLILTAVIMSSTGVMLGLLITNQSFGVVMSGIGIVALAGIVVNNNIVLIDTYDQMKKTAANAREAIILTGAQRLRPVLLTTVTTVLGLMPMVLGINIDWTTRVVQIGAPSGQWWTQLSSAIVFGLSFATILTLVVTPCALVFFDDCLRLFKRDKTPKDKSIRREWRTKSDDEAEGLGGVHVPDPM